MLLCMARHSTDFITAYHLELIKTQKPPLRADLLSNWWNWIKWLCSHRLGVPCRETHFQLVNT